MAFSFNNQGGGTSTSTSTATPGTVRSLGLYANPGVPRQSQAAGIQGTDDRGYTRNVQGNELAVNQLNDMTNSNSPYMQSARQQGLVSAARRGLMNSSIAAGNSQGAAINAASPFAMQAADAYGRAQTENLGYLNQNLMQERDIQNRALMQARSEEGQFAGASAMSQAMSDEMQQQYRMFQENLAYEGEQRGLDRAHDYGINDQGYQQDIGRLGYTQNFQSREADRDVLRNTALQDNQYSNQRYNDSQQMLLAAGIGTSNQAMNFILDQFANDPSTSIEDMDGLFQWTNQISGQQINNLIAQYFGG